MENNTLREKLRSMLHQRIYIETKTHHIGYLLQKGVLGYVGEDFVELDAGNKIIIIPLSEIRTVTLRK